MRNPEELTQYLVNTPGYPVSLLTILNVNVYITCSVSSKPEETGKSIPDAAARSSSLM